MTTRERRRRSLRSCSRRIAAARAPGELRALRDELKDRFGPPPEPVEALLTVQRAKIELAREGARSLQLRGVGEGVEPAEQLDFLRRHGCDDYQGFYASAASTRPNLNPRRARHMRP